MTVFRPLEAEVTATVAGWHDGFRIFQRVDRSRDAMVAAHEQVHGQIFRVTPDGNLLTAAMQLSVGATDESLQRSAELLRDDLIQVARDPHEIFATYLGIKRGDPDLRGAWYDRLTPEYQAYYHRLADVIDRRYTNPGLQRLLGTNTAAVVFSSLLLGRLEDDLASLRPLVATEDPSARLGVALLTLSDVEPADMIARLQSRANDVARARGATAWRLNGPEEWETIHAADAVAIEEAVAEEFRTWLIATSGLPVLEASDRALGTDRLVAILRRGGFAAERAAPEHHGSRLRRELEAEVRDQLESRIHNPTAVFPPRELYDRQNAERILQTPASIVVVLHEQKPGLCAWSIHRWSGEVPPTSYAPPTGHTSFDTLDSVWCLLGEWGRRRDADLAVPRVLALVTAVTTLDELTAYHDRITRTCPDVLSVACWYWLGSREDLLRGYESWPRPIERGSARMIRPALEPSDEERIDGIQVVVFDVPHVGFVFRVLNVAAAAALAAADSDKWTSNHFVAFADSERALIVQCAVSAIMRIRNYF